MKAKATVAIIDYGAGNLRSVANAVTRLGYQPIVTDKPAEVLRAPAVILPGVGAAADTMAGLNKTGMAEVVRRLIDEDRPLFAVCIGLQILLSATEEGGGSECLGVVPGIVRRLPDGLKIPHMGWNQVAQRRKQPIFKEIPDKANFYFVHSYYADPEDNSLVAATTNYGLPWCSVLVKGNLVATQFHPEKSGTLGLEMYDNFLRMATGGE
jgi:glutamine amidotransferase